MTSIVLCGSFIFLVGWLPGIEPGAGEWLGSYTALVINIASCVDCCVTCIRIALEDREAVSYCAGSIALDVHDVCLDAGIDSVFLDGEFGCCFHVLVWLVGYASSG